MQLRAEFRGSLTCQLERQSAFVAQIRRTQNPLDRCHDGHLLLGEPIDKQLVGISVGPPQHEDRTCRLSQDTLGDGTEQQALDTVITV